MQRLLALIFFSSQLLMTAPAEEAAPVELPVSIATAGGSRLRGFLSIEKPFIVRTESGAIQRIATGQIKAILFGERPDRNQENEALVALGDLQSDQYDVREKALARLRALGRSAVRPLRQTSTSADAEVAARARALLAEINLQNAAGVIGERVDLADGTSVSGELTPNEIVVRSRWGKFRFPLSCLEALTVLTPADIQAEGMAAAGDAVRVRAPERQAMQAVAERWDDDAMTRLGAPMGKTISGMPLLMMDRVPNPDANAGAGKKMVPTKVGDALESAYAAWGVLFSGEPNVRVQVSGDPVGPEPGFSLEAKNSDLNVTFVMPGSFNAKTGISQPGGVTAIGAMISPAQRFTYGLAVYDRAGRQLAEVLNVGFNDDVILANNIRASEFLGVRSKVPIARARFFRTADAGTKDINVDDIVFDRVVTVDRPATAAGVWLSSGERLAGTVEAAALEEGIKLRADFQDTAAAISLEEIERYEPARQLEESAKKEDTLEEKKEKAKRMLFGSPHGILLQSGESFRALFLKLDDKTVRLMLPGRVELELPRQTLRKIDFHPTAADPGELPGAVSVADAEKPGVDFRRKEKPEGEKVDAPPADPKAEAKPEKKVKKDLLQGTQELEAMPDAKILEADMLTGDLTIEDENGPWTIGLAPVKTLVFPKDQNVRKAPPKFRDWVLTLREGSRFEIVLTGISVKEITAEMAGGTVILPSHVVDSIQKQKR